MIAWPAGDHSTDAKLIEAIRAELGKHSWDTFVDNPPAIARGGNGVVVPGCPACKIRINTMNSFMEHVEGKVLQVISSRAQE